MSSTSPSQSPPSHHHHHQPLLSSLVVRPSLTENSPPGAAAHSNDYEPGELRRDPPPVNYSRSDRYSDDAGLLSIHFVHNTHMDALTIMECQQ